MTKVAQIDKNWPAEVVWERKIEDIGGTDDPLADNSSKNAGAELPAGFGSSGRKVSPPKQDAWGGFAVPRQVANPAQG